MRGAALLLHHCLSYLERGEISVGSNAWVRLKWTFISLIHTEYQVVLNSDDPWRYSEDKHARHLANLRHLSLPGTSDFKSPVHLLSHAT